MLISKQNQQDVMLNLVYNSLFHRALKSKTKQK